MVFPKWSKISVPRDALKKKQFKEVLWSSEFGKSYILLLEIHQRKWLNFVMTLYNSAFPEHTLY